METVEYNIMYKTGILLHTIEKDIKITITLSQYYPLKPLDEEREPQNINIVECTSQISSDFTSNC